MTLSWRMLAFSSGIKRSSSAYIQQKRNHGGEIWQLGMKRMRHLGNSVMAASASKISINSDGEQSAVAAYQRGVWRRRKAYGGESVAERPQSVATTSSDGMTGR